MKVRQNVGARIGQLSVLELGFMYEGGKMEAHRVGPRIGTVCHAEPTLCMPCECPVSSLYA
jgi:hypothetical protein